MQIFIFSPNLDALFSDKQKAVLERAGELKIYTKPQKFSEIKELFLKGDKIIAVDPDFCDWSFPKELITKIPDLKAICLQTTSFSWIDSELAAKHNIPVINLRGFSTEAVAEWAVMMALNVARRIPLLIKDEWKQDYVKHQGLELKGRTAGIVGLGKIGSRIAELCEGLGMDVIYWSQTKKQSKFKAVELAELMKTAEVILPALAQNEATKGLISDEMLKSMKPDAIFISIVHQVYNHELLLELAANNKIFGYGFEDSKVKLKDFKGNVWTGAELAWCTDGSMQRNAEMWLESILKSLKGDYENRIN